MSDDIGYLDALRQLLAKHEQTPDDARGGTRVIYAEAHDKIRLGDYQTRMRRRVEQFIARAEQRFKATA